MVDDDTNSIVDWKWQLIPIDEHIAEPDLRMAEFIESFKDVVDRKYSVIITKFAEQAHPPARAKRRRSLGNLLADALAETTGADVVLLGAGSVRVKELGPAVTPHGLHGLLPLRRLADPLHGQRRGAQAGSSPTGCGRRTGTARASATR